MPNDTERDPRPFRLRKLSVKGVKVAPDWREWKLIPKADVRQACLLSLNLNPYRIHENAWPADAEDYYDEFFLRQRVLQANLKSDPERFSGNRYHTHVILLSELAAWALSVDWDIPPELAELAPKPNATTNSAASRITDEPASAAKVSHGGAAGTSNDPPQESEEPRMRYGSNSAKAYKKWIAWQANRLMQTGDTTKTLGGRIAELAEERRYMNEGGDPILLATVIRNIPAGLTGGRCKNGRNSQRG